MSECCQTSRTQKQVFKAVTSGHWDLVFRALGYRLAVLPDSSKSHTANTELSDWDDTERLLDAVTKDFWRRKVSWTYDGIRFSKSALSPSVIVEAGVFPSLRIDTVHDKYALVDKDQHRVAEAALTHDNWQAVTVILFLLTRCGVTSASFKVALCRAAQLRDWRYLTVVAAHCFKVHVKKPWRFLEILGLNDLTVLHSRAKRVSAIYDLLPADEEFRGPALEVVVLTLSAYARQNPSDQNWLLAVETAQDFQCETPTVKSILACDYKSVLFARKPSGTKTDKVASRKVEIKPGKKTKTSVQPAAKLETASSDKPSSSPSLCSHLLRSENLYLLRPMIQSQNVPETDIGHALLISEWTRDWVTFISCVYAGGGGCFVGGESALQGALSVPAFDLPSDLLPPPEEVDLSNAFSWTLLHTAVQHWQDITATATSTASATNDRAFDNVETRTALDNVVLLLANGADASVPYPDGSTVLQKVLTDPHGRRTSGRRLLLALADAAENQGVDMDWEIASDSGWSVLHVLCHEGDSEGVLRLVRLGANPLQRRDGWTLIDTAVSSELASWEAKREMVKVLVKIPDLMADHLYAIRTRKATPAGDADSGPSSYTTPLEHLLSRVKESRCVFDIIKILCRGNGLSKTEYRDSARRYISSCAEGQLDPVAVYLDKKRTSKA